MIKIFKIVILTILFAGIPFSSYSQLHSIIEDDSYRAPYYPILSMTVQSGENKIGIGTSHEQSLQIRFQIGISEHKTVLEETIIYHHWEITAIRIEAFPFRHKWVGLAGELRITPPIGDIPFNWVTPIQLLVKL